ncbi:hypothetical protein LNQ03_08175 [Klebsiella pneumoniae subsp. pneumoniae]|nr:hypothetical protein [Klebsiella pneumoniae subsp. pneumoniae]
MAAGVTHPRDHRRVTAATARYRLPLFCLGFPFTFAERTPSPRPAPLGRGTDAPACWRA